MFTWYSLHQFWKQMALKYGGEIPKLVNQLIDVYIDVSGNLDAEWYFTMFFNF